MYIYLDHFSQYFAPISRILIYDSWQNDVIVYDVIVKSMSWFDPSPVIIITMLKNTDESFDKYYKYDVTVTSFLLRWLIGMVKWKTRCLYLAKHFLESIDNSYLNSVQIMTHKLWVMMLSEIVTMTSSSDSFHSKTDSWHHQIPFTLLLDFWFNRLNVTQWGHDDVIESDSWSLDHKWPLMTSFEPYLYSPVTPVISSTSKCSQIMTHSLLLLLFNESSSDDFMT